MFSTQRVKRPCSDGIPKRPSICTAAAGGYSRALGAFSHICALRDVRAFLLGHRSVDSIGKSDWVPSRFRPRKGVRVVIGWCTCVERVSPLNRRTVTSCFLWCTSRSRQDQLAKVRLGSSNLVARSFKGPGHGLLRGLGPRRDHQCCPSFPDGPEVDSQNLAAEAPHVVIPRSHSAPRTRAVSRAPDSRSALPSSEPRPRPPSLRAGPGRR